MTDLAVYDAPQNAVTLFGAEGPRGTVRAVAETADVLAEVVRSRGLTVPISGREYVKVDGYTLLGTMLGVFPVLDGDPERVEIDGVTGWRATVKAVTKDGAEVGRASALCLRSEANWRGRDEFALMSMAQTRATGKALRSALGFVMSLAGFAEIPAEEMVATPTPPAEVIDQVDVDDIPFNPAPGAVTEANTGAFQPPAGASEGKATAAQTKMLYRLRRKLVHEMHQPEDAILAQMEKDYGTRDDRKLSKAQASEFIGKLKRLAGEPVT